MRNQLEGSTTSVDQVFSSLPPADLAFFLGCLLGDGWIGLQRKRFCHLRIGHSDKQQAYLQWKADNLNRIFGKDRRLLGPYTVGCGTGEQQYQHYLYCIDDHERLSPFFNLLYQQKDGKPKLVITDALLKCLTLESLAIYWCDDGSLWSSERTTKYRSKSGDTVLYPYIESRGSLATCRYEKHEVEMIRDWIRKLTGIELSISRQKCYLVLQANKTKLRSLLPMLVEFTPDCMKHKVDLSHCRVR